MDTEPETIKFFYSYAHEDKTLRDELEKHLGTLKRLELITEWHDRDIHAGTEWKHEIDMHLNAANIILLLISSDFMSSDYCYSVEMRRALERHRLREARVIPILLRPVDWEGTPIAPLQMLPSGTKPITRWQDKDEAFSDVAKGIRKVIKELTTTLPTSSSSLEKKVEARSYDGELSQHPPFDEDNAPRKSLQRNNQDEQHFLSHKTINTHGAVDLFHRLMQPDSEIRVLRLVGDGKMGKSHLQTKVFPTLAQRDYQARYATLDLRYRLHGVLEILKMACDFIGMQNCKGYNTAYQVWLSQSRSRSNLKAEVTRRIFSFFHLSRKESPDDPHYRDMDLTQQFVNDISVLQDKPLLLLFDSVNNANESVQQWLMDVLLVQVSRLAHIRTIVAGRSLPDAHGSYATLCANYQLKPITDVEEYIAFCRKANLMLEEQAIRAIAYGCDYIPGMFIDFVIPRFQAEGC